MKQWNAFKAYSPTYYAEMLNLFDPELLYKDAKFALENKFERLLADLRGFKFVITLFLDLKKKSK